MSEQLVKTVSRRALLATHTSTGRFPSVS